MVPLHQPKSSFGKWLLKYRLLITLLSIFILIPVIFVIALYVGDYLKYKKVSFDDQVITQFESTSLTYEQETLHEEINLVNTDLIVKIKLESILVPEYSDETGNYVFKSKYEEVPNKSVSNVRITMILQTDWMDAKSQPYQTSLAKSYGSSTQMLIFSEMLPTSPLLFVKVERPHLYVKVTYDINLGLGQNETREVYYKAVLKGLTPSYEIDNNKA